MGFFGVVLGMLVGGYSLGVWTARNVFRERQSAYEDGTPEQQSLLVPIREATWTLEPSR